MQKPIPLSVFVFIYSLVVTWVIYVISRQNNVKLHGLPYLLVEFFCIGIPVVWTDSRSLGVQPHDYQIFWDG